LDIEKLVHNISNLASLPDVCLRANELLEDPKASAAEVGDVLSFDPGLTARLLKIVNSAIYGFPSRIETVDRAITIIGTKDLRALVLATAAVEAFSKIPADLVDMDAFWFHSVFTGLAAKQLANESGMAGAETIFVTGLLHDVGKLVMYHELPKQSRQILEQCLNDKHRQYQLEQSSLGFSHADVGAALLRAWKLPESLCMPVKYHHEPSSSDSFQQEAALLHIANGIANSVEPGLRGEEEISRESLHVEPSSWGKAGVSPDLIESTVSEVNIQSFELLEIIAPGATSIF